MGSSAAELIIRSPRSLKWLSSAGALSICRCPGGRTGHVAAQTSAQPWFHGPVKFGQLGIQPIQGFEPVGVGA